MEPAAALSGNRPRTDLTVNVHVLPLNEGLYGFSIRNAPASSQLVNGLPVPAIQIAAAPTNPPGGLVEFLSAPQSTGTWLFRSNDFLVAKITGNGNAVVLTSIRTQNLPALEMEARRLDGPAQAPTAVAATTGTTPVTTAPAGALPVAPPPPVPVPPKNPAPAPVAAPGYRPSSALRVVRSQIVAHIQNRGDLPFVDVPWAGCLGQRLAIEAFLIQPLEHILPDQIEYKALTANGTETPWITGNNVCGSRGMGVPIIGFAIRLKPAAAAIFDCEYSGAFVSGTIVGSLRNGAPCRSTTPNDALEGIQLRLVEQRPADAGIQAVAAGSFTNRGF